MLHFYMAGFFLNFRSGLKSELPSHVVNTVRGKGLFNAIVVSEGFDAWDICVEVRFNYRIVMRF